MSSEMSYAEWNDGDDDPNLSPRSTAGSTIELESLNPPSNTNLTETPDNKPQVTKKKSVRMSVKFARMRIQGNRERRMEDGGDGATDASSYTNTLRVIKVVSLLLIGACALVGMVFSKITFVSITSRMYTLYSATTADNNQKSVIFFQLVFILVIPELISLVHCLVWGFIGKTSKSFPWPSYKAMTLVSTLLHVTFKST